jgi:hypothetical protein
MYASSQLVRNPTFLLCIALRESVLLTDDDDDEMEEGETSSTLDLLASSNLIFILQVSVGGVHTEVSGDILILIVPVGCLRLHLHLPGGRVMVVGMMMIIKLSVFVAGRIARGFRCE